MNYKGYNIPHQYRSPYWYGDNQEGRIRERGFREMVTEFVCIYGEFRFDPSNGILSVIVE